MNVRRERLCILSWSRVTDSETGARRPRPHQEAEMLRISRFLPLFVLPLAACGFDSSDRRGDDLALAAHPGQALFERNCLACHSIGEGDRIGPDLKDIHARRDEDWLIRWIDDPVTMAQEDPLGQQLLAEWNNVPMQPSGLSRSEIADVLDYIRAASEGRTGQAAVANGSYELGAAEFAAARDIYFDRCAGCHGTLRSGATGPNIEPALTRQRGTPALLATLRHGLPGGMPAWGDAGILGEDEIVLMAKYVQLDPPEPPLRPLAAVRESWSLAVPVAQRPTAPLTRRNWENFFGVILRDAGKVAIIDGDTKELVKIIDTGFAVHILRSSSSGRYYYAVGRDGRISLIDLWSREPTLVAQVQGCVDARSVDGSKYQGYEDRYLIEGCYWPPQYVVYDGLTLEPLRTHDVAGTSITGEPLREVRIAAMVASHDAPVWVMGLKESGHVAIVDYSKPDFPLVARIPAELFLHDGGWDRTGRYFLIAANMSNRMVVVDVREQKLVTTFETGNKPHPGRGANWEDPHYGWVNATVHIGEPLLAVYGADPANRPEHAWQVVRRVALPSAGSLFLKTHPNSPWVWMDMTMSNSPEQARTVCVYSKSAGRLDKCWPIAEHGSAVHFEYNRDGTEVWASVWDRRGELVIYDDRTLAEKQRIRADWLVTPTGKFNVYNTAHDVY
jgi:nitrite reductase (NO-forming) / hydroxylamine reductase